MRSDRQLCNRLKTDPLFRWFVDLPLDSESLDASVYSKNQQRLLQHQVAELFFTTVPAPVAARYVWANNPACNLTNRAGLPLAPFRTDTW